MPAKRHPQTPTSRNEPAGSPSGAGASTRHRQRHTVPPPHAMLLTSSRTKKEQDHRHRPVAATLPVVPSATSHAPGHRCVMGGSICARFKASGPHGYPWLGEVWTPRHAAPIARAAAALQQRATSQRHCNGPRNNTFTHKREASHRRSMECTRKCAQKARY